MHIVNRTNKYGTFIVLTHVLINIIHGAAHRQLHVGLHSAGMLFVASVVVLCPLLALALLWTCQKRLGLILLTFSMAASATFGLYNHFVVSGPDHVSGQPPGPWSTVFCRHGVSVVPHRSHRNLRGLLFPARAGIQGSGIVH